MRHAPVLMQLLWTACALMAALLVGSYAAWAYPQGAGEVWWVAWGSMLAIAGMSIGPIRRAIGEGGAHHDG